MTWPWPLALWTKLSCRISLVRLGRASVNPPRLMLEVPPNSKFRVGGTSAFQAWVPEKLKSPPPSSLRGFTRPRCMYWLNLKYLSHTYYLQECGCSVNFEFCHVGLTFKIPQSRDAPLLSMSHTNAGCWNNIYFFMLVFRHPLLSCHQQSSNFKR